MTVFLGIEATMALLSVVATPPSLSAHAGGSSLGAHGPPDDRAVDAELGSATPVTESIGDVPGAPVLTVGTGASFVGWAGPDGGLGVDAFVELAASERGPAARLSIWHRRGESELAGLPIRLSHWGASLEGCPIRLVAGSVFVEPCAGAEAGVITAASSELTRELRSLDAVALGRVGFLPNVRIAIEAQVELGVPLINDQLGVLSSSGKPATIARAPDVAAALRLGVGTRFP